MKSIRARLLASLIALLATGILAAGSVTYHSVLRETEVLLDYQLRQMALSLRDQGEIDVARAGALRDESLDFVVQIWTADGRSIYATRPYEELPTRVVLGFADVAAGDRIWRSYSVASRDRVIQVAQPLQIRRRLAADAALRSVLPLVAIAPLLAAALWALVGWAFRPLRRVVREVQSRDAGSLLARGPLAPAEEGGAAGLPHEVAPLVQALDDLLTRLAASFDAQRAFVADAAHELRSPLTALKLQVSALGRAPDEPSRRAAQEALAAGVERATRLVEQLLTLARSEPGGQPLRPERLDLAELVRQVLADMVPYAESRRSTLELDAAGPVPLEGDRAALSALVRNLADNAIRYAPRGAAVRVAVGREGGAPCLVVDDAGPGIPPSERARVFDRFYRRTAAVAEAPAEGSGLGLAIVQRVAQRHGATVALTDSPLGGLRVTVRFPWPADPRERDAGETADGANVAAANRTDRANVAAADEANGARTARRTRVADAMGRLDAAGPADVAGSQGGTGASGPAGQALSDGAAGPAGPAGSATGADATGATGVTGAAGTSGTSGTAGTAGSADAAGAAHGRRG